MIGIKKWSMILVWGVFVILYYLPEQVIYGGNPMFGCCLHELLLGFQCPGCGMTRAIYSFLHLDFLKAIEFNIAIIGFIPLVLLQTLDAFGLLKQYKSNFIYYSFILLLFIVYAKRIVIYLLL